MGIWEKIDKILKIIGLIFSFSSVILVYLGYTWYTNPKPLLETSINVQDEIKSGAVNINVFYAYSPDKGVKLSGEVIDAYIGWNNETRIYHSPPDAGCCKKIKVLIYNAGRKPIEFPKLYVNLYAENVTNVFPFKIHSVITPIDKLYYDSRKGLMFYTYEIYGESSQIPFPYSHLSFSQSGYGYLDFPPSIDPFSGKVYFSVPIFSKENINNLRYLKSEFLGPFRLGTVEPGKTVEFEISLFAVKGEHCKKGWLNLTITSLNTAQKEIIIPLRSYDPFYDLWNECG